jgi:hypothetical protein
LKFLELAGPEKKALHESKAKDVSVHGTLLWRLLPPPGGPGLHAAVTVTVARHGALRLPVAVRAQGLS